jgi:hypothetical protein
MMLPLLGKRELLLLRHAQPQQTSPSQCSQPRFVTAAHQVWP